MSSLQWLRMMQAPQAGKLGAVAKTYTRINVSAWAPHLGRDLCWLLSSLVNGKGTTDVVFPLELMKKRSPSAVGEGGCSYQPWFIALTEGKGISSAPG